MFDAARKENLDIAVQLLDAAARARSILEIEAGW